MVPMINLVYYASVARRDNVVLAEHKNSKEDLAEVGLECLEKVPAYHNRFTYTVKQRMFMFLMDDAFTYSAIVDEALGKLKSFGFLERVRDEFQLLLRSRGLDGSRLEKYALVGDFASVFKGLVKPLVGVPQKELDLDDQNSDSKDNTALSPCASQSEHSHGPIPGASSPLTGNGIKLDKKGTRDHEVKEIMMTNSNNSSKALDKGRNKYDQGGGGRLSDTEERKKSRQYASRKWWKNVKIVLLLDLVVCCILFAIWLGICRGFSCVKS